ncbi:transcriptional repressor MprA [Thorsellia anophelis]|uniref:MarR family transcriptional regulator, negative regulator of the multidrug operon emrRAB n=1 Tax=Thorsellia anophelis DSM 18579 TaxID=1123402 RepID=A0A1I0DGH4_9GAMM|nr:transcriptional repressor MprA [Thorsellia anophelis]SET31505.1 MarR family transcriptional regulator, negative regulator of the multidrug operon emrRAB [Thorsellia anophelis DSM 18579]
MNENKNLSFQSIEEKIRQYASRYEDYPLQAMLMYRMHVHIHHKMQDARNAILKENDINETLFMALIIIDSKPDRVIQPSELSSILGSSRTHITRIADELVARGWIERYSTEQDRRCLFLKLTESGVNFLAKISPKQFANLNHVWSALSFEEHIIYEKLSRKLLSKIEELTL